MDNIKAGIDGAEEVAVDLDVEIKRLAGLPRLEYELIRAAEAERLGVRVTALDDEVTRAHKTVATDGQGESIAFNDPPPWSEPVDGAELLDQIATAAQRYLVLPRGGASLIALWTVHTHTINAFYHTPRLAVSAAERGCGKSVVLDFLELLTPRAVKTENVSTAVVFRLTEEYQPTLLCDEVDTYFRDRDELVGILNGGHKKGARVFRCEGDKNEVKGFRAFAAVATAGIGKLPPTLGDRSIPLRMRRARKEERPTPLRPDRAQYEQELKRKAIRWAADNFKALSDADPDVPDWMFNRPADNWRPLFAIADHVSGAWPARAREVAALLSSENAGDESYRLMVLHDLHDLFVERNTEYLLSEDIVEAFRTNEERPWADWKAKNGFTKNQLARYLKEFDLKPKAIWAANGKRGYTKEDCEGVFAAYLPPATAMPLCANETGGHSDNTTAMRTADIAVANSRNPAETLEHSGIAVVKGGNGAETPSRDQINPFEDDDIERAAIQSEADFADTAASTKSDPAPDEPQPGEVKWTL